MFIHKSNISFICINITCRSIMQVIRMIRYLYTLQRRMLQGRSWMATNERITITIETVITLAAIAPFSKGDFSGRKNHHNLGRFSGTATSSRDIFLSLTLAISRSTTKLSLPVMRTRFTKKCRCQGGFKSLAIQRRSSQYIAHIFCFSSYYLLLLDKYMENFQNRKLNKIHYKLI